MQHTSSELTCLVGGGAHGHCDHGDGAKLGRTVCRLHRRRRQAGGAKLSGAKWTGEVQDDGTTKK